MRSSSKEGSYSRLADFVSLNSRPRVIKQRERLDVVVEVGDESMLSFENTFR